MNIHKSARLAPAGRGALVAAVAEGPPYRQTAADFRVSWATVRKWVGRYRAGGPAALGDRSSRPRRCPRQHPRRVRRQAVQALQLGHRISRDLDLFRAGPFDPAAWAAGLAGLGRVAVQGRSAGTLHVTLEGIRVSFRSAEAPLLFAGTPYRGLVLADPRDIAVIKVIAIGGRGSRRDFVDLFFYLRGGGSLEGVFALIRRRFAAVDYNAHHLLRSLVYFEDAETEPMPRMIRRAAWPEIRRAIVAEVKRLS